MAVRAPPTGIAVFRTAIYLTIACGAAASAEPSGRPAAEPIALIDARANRSDAPLPPASVIAAELNKLSVLQTIHGERASELLGIMPRRSLARGHLNRSRVARDNADCSLATTEARTAVVGFAALEATGQANLDELADAYGVILGCASHTADPMAQTALHLLEVLASKGSARAGTLLSSRKHQIIDATANGMMSEVTIESSDGAVVWVDHQQVGRAPVTVLLPEGEHVVAVSADLHTATAFHKEFLGRRQTLAVSLAAPSPSDSSRIAALVQAWQEGSRSLDAESVGQTLDAVNARFAVIIVDGGGTPLLRVWGKASSPLRAAPLGEFKLAELLELADLISTRSAEWDGRGANPDLPVSVDDMESPMNEPEHPPQKWWVYATIIGAVIGGSVVVWAIESADDHQRIELSWP